METYTDMEIYFGFRLYPTGGGDIQTKITQKCFEMSKCFLTVNDRYSRVSNESTGTLEKNQPNIQAVRNFFCGTIDGNSRFWTAVLLFQPPL